MGLVADLVDAVSCLTRYSFHTPSPQNLLAHPQLSSDEAGCVSVWVLIRSVISLSSHIADALVLEFY